MPEQVWQFAQILGADEQPELEQVLHKEVRFIHTFWMLTLVDLQHEPRIKLVWDF